MKKKKKNVKTRTFFQAFFWWELLKQKQIEVNIFDQNFVDENFWPQIFRR